MAFPRTLQVFVVLRHCVSSQPVGRTTTIKRQYFRLGSRSVPSAIGFLLFYRFIGRKRLFVVVASLLFAFLCVLPSPLISDILAIVNPSDENY